MKKIKKKYIIFGVCLFSLFSVFTYAQLARKNQIATDPPTYHAPKGEVLGISTQIKKTKIPITIKIDKDPVYLYWPQKVTVETVPNVEVRLKITYPNGSINNSGTISGYSDSSGKFENKWTIIGKKDIIGRAKIEVSVGNLQNYTTAESSFDITSYQKPTSSPAVSSAPTVAPSPSPTTTPPSNNLEQTSPNISPPYSP